MAGELGKASLDLEANLGPFERNLESGHAMAGRMEHALDALAAVADVCQKALNDVKLDASHAATSRVSAEQILSGVRGISDESRTAAREIDKVKLGSEQSTETEVAGDIIDHKLDEIRDSAERTQRALDGVRLRLAAAGGGGSRRPGYGIGPFGAGYGRLGVVGTGVALGVAAGPAIAPAAFGLLAAIPALATTAAGALGTLALAFDGVGKAIGGDKKAFNDLTPAGKQFVLTVRSLDGWFDKLRQTAAKSLFPGLTAGLKAALSPGTVNLITKAVTEFGYALGQAGKMWGQFFGSPAFQRLMGPLMKEGADGFVVFTKIALNLADALLRLSNAAIPFLNWLGNITEKGSKWVDQWIKAEQATGGLARAMNAAQGSLRLVGGLVEALAKVVIALGEALYPVGEVLIKDLTDGLTYLAGVVDRNRKTIQEIAVGALKAFVTVVKLAAVGVRTLWDGLNSLIGHKAIVVGAIAAIGVAVAMALGPTGAVIAGVLIAVGLIRNHWAQLANFFGNVGRSIIYAFKYVWYILEKGALKAALAIVEPFSHLPGVLGGWARTAKNRMQGQLDRLHAPNMDWRNLAARDGALTGTAWRQAFEAAAAKKRAQLQQDQFKPLPFAFYKAMHPGATRKDYETYVKLLEAEGKDVAHRRHHRPHHHRHHGPSMPTDTATPFGPPPPFTKNTGGSGSGGGSVIPNSVAQLEAIARRQDQEAAALNYVGKKAREHLNSEIGDLQKADRLLEEKLKSAHGKKRIELYNAITANLKKIAEARKRLHQTIGNAQQERLQYALDEAAAAVAHAKKGSAAYDRAIKEEEKALRAEIAYWTKRAHNMHLSIKARDEALRKEISYQKQLNSLLKPQAQAAAANQEQFLQIFNQLQGAFAPNVQSVPGQDASGKKTDTHLYEIKHESRKQTRHLQALRDRARFPHSELGVQAAMAVTG